MNELILINNLQQLIRIHGNPSISDLARLTNIPQPTLHHILSGATKNPRKKSLEALADFFSISVKQLIGEEPLPNIIPDIVKENLHIRAIPIIQWDMLMHWPPDDVKNLHLKEILLDKKVADNAFALVVQDSLMEPMFPQDALLIFDSGKSPMDRDFVVAHDSRDNSILFNRLFIDNHQTYIKQNLTDGNVQLIKLDLDTDQIIGTLIEVRIQF